MNVNLISGINDLGYGYAGLHICDELMKLGHNVSLFPIGKIKHHIRHQENIELAINNAKMRFDVNAPCIRLWHQNDLSMFVGRGKHVGFPIFELDTFTKQEKHHLSSCDEIFVCSNWAKSIIRENNIDVPVRVIPLGVDGEIFSAKMSKRSPTVFLNIGKWEVRKGHDLLIRAFNEAFDTTDNVELWMMCDNPFLSETQTKQWHNLYRYTSVGEKVRFIPRVETDVQVAEIMQQADCGIFPSFAEGWNLEALEILACGKQVIATEYSAHTEFLTNENSWQIPIEGLASAFDGIWFHNQGNWAKPSYSSLIKHLRYVHELKQNNDLQSNTKGIETAKRFSWENTARTIIQYLQE